MRRSGEISQPEIDAVTPLDLLLLSWSGKENGDFWRREALWSDERWEQVRQLARTALEELPDEERASE